MTTTTTYREPERPSLGAFMQKHLNIESRTIDLGATQTVRRMAAQAPRVAPEENGLQLISGMAATFLWQSLLRQRYFDDLLEPPNWWGTQEHFVVPHGDRDQPRYDLLVFDPTVSETNGHLLPRHRVDRSVANHWGRHLELEWVSRLRARTFDDVETAATLIRMVSAVDIDEMFEVLEPAIVRMPAPLVEVTSVPTPSWPVARSVGLPPTSTAGVIAENDGGTWGTTVAYHDFVAAVPAVAVGSQVFVSGQPARIVSIDPVSDSCLQRSILVS